LWDNNIGVEGAKHIAGALAVNKKLRDLNVSFNSFQDAGAKAIADSLKRNDALQILNLDGNGISDEGGENLACALGSNEKIQRVSLKKNAITRVGLPWSDVEHAVIDLRDNPIEASSLPVSSACLKDVRVFFQCKKKHVEYWHTYLNLLQDAPCHLHQVASTPTPVCFFVSPPPPSVFLPSNARKI
jgi:hypothetical protein